MPAVLPALILAGFAFASLVASSRKQPLLRFAVPLVLVAQVGFNVVATVSDLQSAEVRESRVWDAVNRLDIDHTYLLPIDWFYYVARELSDDSLTRIQGGLQGSNGMLKFGDEHGLSDRFLRAVMPAFTEDEQVIVQRVEVMRLGQRRQSLDVRFYATNHDGAVRFGLPDSLEAVGLSQCGYHMVLP